MKLVHKHIIIASMLACVGMAATAQTPAAATDAPKGPPATHERHERMGRPDPAKMQAFQAKRQAALKEKLKITPAQEAAWTSFTTATQMQPKGPRPDRAEFEKLTTPQRIDKMREMRTQHAAAADKRDEAVKTFYAALSAE
ncbi:MAG: Spy/CpxP family protein refolding chaperone, partial [Xylophilus sp.]|nr:Spy/CpxP family protein refolding chaperone [Xylophilus sp.]